MTSSHGFEEQAYAFRDDSVAPLADPTAGLGALFDPEGLLSLEAVCARFGLSRTQLAEVIGVPRDAIYRPERFAAPKTQSRVLELVEILHRINDWAGGPQQALAWYRSYSIPAFGRTCESVVKEGHATAMRDFLDHIATGGFA